MFGEKLFYRSFRVMATSGNRWYKHPSVAHLRPQKAEPFSAELLLKQRLLAGNEL